MLVCTDISFSYKKKPVIDRLSFSLENGKILALMGKSGSGKTTLLDLIGGRLIPQSGSIRSDFQKISTVFQEPRLFSQLTALENVAIVAKEEKEAEIWLRFVELDGAQSLYPDELSGGMQSRCALARALAFGGDLFLLDEPFSALDENMAKRLALRLKAKIKEQNASAIFVSHNKELSQLFADDILELS